MKIVMIKSGSHGLLRKPLDDISVVMQSLFLKGVASRFYKYIFAYIKAVSIRKVYIFNWIPRFTSQTSG